MIDQWPQMPIFLSNVFAAVCLLALRVGLPPRGLSAGWSTSRVRSAPGEGSTSVRGLSSEGSAPKWCASRGICLRGVCIHGGWVDPLETRKAGSMYLTRMLSC